MSADSGGSPAQNPGRGRRRRRRKGGKDPRDEGPKPGKPGSKELSAAQVIQRAAEPERGRGTDEPLTPSEVAEMKRHFAFLHQYRRELKLKLNAQEDLLVNGRREPTHRGVCLHLLGKLELARVQSAVERLEPKLATKLLAGVVRFSPDINYVLLFLQCVKKSESHAEATAALSQALRRIEFSEVSPAQMRRVVELLVEVLPAKELPLVLFGLLDSARFREAFDRSQEGLPEALAGIVVPLRAAHAVLLRGKPNPLSPADLVRGCELLLGVTPAALGELEPAARRRLFEHGIAQATRARRAPGLGLLALVDAFQSDTRLFGDLLLGFAAAELAAAEPDRARKTLRRLVTAAPDFRRARDWLDALDVPRVGRIANLGGPRPSKDGNPKQGQGRNVRSLPVAVEEVSVAPGFALDVQRPVWFWLAAPERGASCAAFGRVLAELAVPGVPHPLDRGTTQEGVPYVATARAEATDRPAQVVCQGADPRTVLDLCSEGIAMLGALAAFGVVLPDFRMRRLAVSREGRLWLEDPWGIQNLDPARAQTAHAELGRRWVQDLLGSLPGFAAAEKFHERVAVAGNCAELLGALCFW